MKQPHNPLLQLAKEWRHEARMVKVKRRVNALASFAITFMVWLLLVTASLLAWMGMVWFIVKMWREVAG